MTLTFEDIQRIGEDIGSCHFCKVRTREYRFRGRLKRKSLRTKVWASQLTGINIHAARVYCFSINTQRTFKTANLNVWLWLAMAVNIFYHFLRKCQKTSTLLPAISIRFLLQC